MGACGARCRGWGLKGWNAVHSHEAGQGVKNMQGASLMRTQEAAGRASEAERLPGKVRLLMTEALLKEVRVRAG